MSYVPKGTRVVEDPRVQELFKYVRLILNSDEHTSQRLKTIAALRKFFLSTDTESAVKNNFEKLLNMLKPLLNDRATPIRQQAALLYGDLGASPGVKNDLNKFISWVFQHLHHTGTDKRLYLSALKEFIEAGDKEALRLSVPMIIINTKAYIDDIANADQLLPAMEILQLLCSTFPDAFYAHFPDVIDLLMGWRLDSSIPQAVADAIASCFQSFRPMWIRQMQFTLTLLNSFVADMFKIIDKSNKLQEKLPSKLYSFMNSFVTIVTATGPEFLSVNPTDASNLIMRYLVCLKSVYEIYFDATWLLQANRGLTELGAVFKESFAPFYFKALELFMIAITPTPKTTILRELLQLQNSLLRSVIGGSGRLSLASVQRLVNSELLRLRLHPDQVCSHSVLDLFRTIIRSVVCVYLSSCFLQGFPHLYVTCSNDDVIELSYSTFENEMALLLRKLKRDPTLDADPSIVADSVLSYVSNLSDAAKLLGYNIQILENLQDRNVKQVTETLKFLISNCHPFEQSFIARDAHLQRTVIFAITKLTIALARAKTITTGHKSPSTILTNFLVSEVVPGLRDVISQALSAANTLGIKLCVLDAISTAIIELVSPQDASQVSSFSNIIFTSVLSLCHDAEEAVRLKVASILKMLVDPNKSARSLITTAQLEMITSVALSKLTDYSSAVQSAFYDVITTVDPFNFPVSSTFWFDMEPNNPPLVAHPSSYWHHKLEALLGEGSDGFNKTIFKQVFAYLEQHLDQTNRNWLLRLMHMSKAFSERATNSESDPELVHEITRVNKQMTEFWALWECAKFFVNSKLRTPLGSPTDSLAAVEKLVAKLAAPQTHEEIHAQSEHVPTPGVKLRFARLALQLANMLERHIYNGYEGSMNMTPITSQSVLSFFRSNRKSCVEWFTKLRPRLLLSSATISSPFDVIRHGFERVAFLTKFVMSPNQNPDPKLKKETENAIAQLALALVRIKDADTLEGLIAWCKACFGPSRRGKNCVPIQTNWLKPLVAQCKGRLQRAVEEYKAVISTRLSDDEVPMESGVLQVIAEQGAECLISLGNWSRVQSWVTETEYVLAQQATAARAHSWNLSLARVYAEALQAYEKEDYNGAHQRLSGFLAVAKWDSLALDWTDSYACLKLSETLLLDAMCTWRLMEDVSNPATMNKTSLLFELRKKLTVARQILEAPLALISDESLRVAHPFLVQLHCVKLVENHIEGKSQVSKQPTLLGKVARLDPNVHDVGTLQKFLRVSNFISRPTFSTKAHQPDMTHVALLLKLARKQANFQLGERISLMEATSENVSSSYHSCMEQAKFLFAQGRQLEALNKLRDFKHSLASNVSETPASQTHAEIQANIMVKMAKWLHNIKDTRSNLAEFLDSLALSPNVFPGVTRTEASIGSFLQEATTLSPQNPNNWFLYADWCYRQGLRTTNMVSHSDGHEQTPLLTQEEQDRLNNTLRKFLHDEAAFVAAQKSVEQQLFAKLVDGSAEDQSEFAPKQVEINKILATLFPDAEQSVIDELRSWWFDVRQRLLQPYKQAVESYFKFLSLKGGSSTKAASSQGGNVSYDGEDRMSSDAAGSHSLTITATLRILRLLIKYGSDMREDFSKWLDSTPAEPWRDIIPQLFARLGHPDEYVRTEVSRLISKVGRSYPHVVVYPAITSIPRTAAQDELTPQQHQILEIKNVLMEHSPQLVTEVESLISELSRITLLWEEQFASLLRELQADLGSRLRTLRDEINRIQENPSIPAAEKKRSISDTYSTIMKTTVVKLERFIREISRPAETRHEKWFQQTYRKLIEDVTQKIKSDTNPEEADASLVTLFKDLVKEFSRYQKRSSLNLEYVSPALLSKTHCSIIPIPGLQTGGRDGVVTIKSFMNNVSILPTKTKPKKIIMIGSDGNKYTFLLKGREDMHLDERIMQFLIIVNHLLKRDKQTYARRLRARHYAVIPIGTNSGLIQWVDGAPPMYTVFTEWQRRAAEAAAIIAAKAAAAASAQQSGATTAAPANAPAPQEQKSSAVPPRQVLRPIDMFYAKLVPVLKSMNVGNVMNRSEWPIEALRRVFAELEHETPKDLLEREIWCSSATTGEWWQKTQQYARSNAVMSMVGYIIGLGDRHLDNILIDFSTGEVVHIDYNVCFEKGLKLRVPEIVPFRMTQNMQRAMGLTGVEGSFRITSEQVLHVLRRSRETLLTLLEAFVYDPLVDWTADKAQIEERTMELDVTFTLISSRIDDMGQQLLNEDSEAFAAGVPQFIPLIAKAVTANNKCSGATKVMEGNMQQRDALQAKITAIMQEQTEMEQKVQSVSENESALLEEIRALTPLLKSALAEFQAVQAAAEAALNELQVVPPNSALAGIPIALRADTGGIPRTLGQLAVLEALQLKDSLVRQCQEKDVEMYNLLVQRQAHLSALVQALKSYHALVAQFPVPYEKTSNTYQWVTILRDLLEHKNVEKALAFVDETEVLARVEAERQAEQVLKTDIQMHTQRLNDLHTASLQFDAKFGQTEQTLAQIKNQLKSPSIPLTLHLNGETDTYVYLQNACLLALAKLVRDIHQLAESSHMQQSKWCFDELEVYMFQATKIVQLLQEGRSTSMRAAGGSIDNEVLIHINNVLKEIQQFRANFSGVVLPDILKAAQAGDKHRHLVTELSKLRQDVDKLPAEPEPSAESLEDETDLWDMPTPSANIISSDGGFFDTVPTTDIHSRYGELLSMESRVAREGLEANRTLFTAVDKLFQALEHSHMQLLDVIINAPSRTSLKEMFLYSKIRTMDNVFSHALGVSGWSQGELKAAVSACTKEVKSYLQRYTTELLVPIAEAILCQFIASHYNDTNIVELDAFASQELVLRHMQSDCTSAELRDHIVARMDEFVHTLRAYHDLSKLKSKTAAQIRKLEAIIQQKQMELNQYQWIHDAAVTKFGAIPPEPGSHNAMRQAHIENIKTLVSAISSLNAALIQSEKGYCALEDQVQRAVHWFVQHNFDKMNAIQLLPNGIALRRQGIVLLNRMINQVLEIAKAVVAFEAHRASMPSNHPAAAHVKRYATIITQYKQVHDNNEALKLELERLTSTRTKLVQEWETYCRTVERDASVVRAVVEANRRLVQELREAALPVHRYSTAYNQVWSEVEPLVLSVVRTTERLEGVQQIHNVAKKLLAHHRRFQSLIKPLARAAEVATSNSEDVAACLAAVAAAISEQDMQLIEEPPIDELLELQQKVEEQLYELAQHGREWLQGDDVGQDSSQEEDGDTSPDNEDTQAARSVALKAAQAAPPARNVTAMNVLRRVKQKLEGCDTGTQKMSVPEQVDKVINDAINPDNLCRLYEGWTAWI